MTEINWDLFDKEFNGLSKRAQNILCNAGYLTRNKVKEAIQKGAFNPKSVYKLGRKRYEEIVIFIYSFIPYEPSPFEQIVLDIVRRRPGIDVWDVTSELGGSPLSNKLQKSYDQVSADILEELCLRSLVERKGTGNAKHPEKASFFYYLKSSENQQIGVLKQPDRPKESTVMLRITSDGSGATEQIIKKVKKPQRTR